MNRQNQPGVPFWKMEAASNDLALVDGRDREFKRPDAFARAVCDRHFGVGADGLMLVGESSRADASARMFNPDGTEDFCGNGLRCVAAWLCETDQAKTGAVTMETPRGLHAAEATRTDERRCSVTVDLLPPAFAPEDVPAEADAEVIRLPLKLDDRTVEVSSVSVGTTHTALFVEKPASDPEFRRVSAAIENHPMFPERTTVLWILPAERGRLEMRVWERGVGETLSCGTGAAAALALAQRLGLAGTSAEVVTGGGALSVSWDGAGPMRLTGPARTVFRGTLSPEWLANVSGKGG